MKVPLLRRRSVSAPKMTVRSHVPLGVRIVVGFAALAVAVVAGVGLSRIGPVRTLLGDPAPAAGRLVAENRVLREAHQRLLESSDPIDSARVMERSTIRELGAQIARLETENARLKEDVAFFEAATADRSAAGAKMSGGGIAIRRFQVTLDRPMHTARYRILLTQDSKATRDFAGDLQLVLFLQQGGRAVNLLLPDPAGKGQGPVSPMAGSSSAMSPYVVRFRSYKRIDGSFELPADATIRSVQARIVEGGTVRAQQTATVE